MTDCLETVPVEALVREIRARYAATPAAAVLTLADLTLELGTGVVAWGAATAQLTRRESELLTALMVAHPEGATGEELGWRVFRSEGAPEHARVYVRYLRQKLPGLLPPIPHDPSRSGRYRLAVDPGARLAGDPPPAHGPGPAPPRGERRAPIVAAPVSAIAPGDEAFVWRDKFHRAYDRMWALETAVGRRLMRHNAGVGRSACDCAECAWLRTLFSGTLPARVRAEAERMNVTTETPANEVRVTPDPIPVLSATPTRTEEAPARPSFAELARGRLAEVEGERAAVDQQLAQLQARQRDLLAEEVATRAAVEAYARAMAGPIPAPAPRERPRATRRTGRGAPLALLLELASTHPVLIRQDAIAAAAVRGISKTAVVRALLDAGRFERVGVGAYRLRAEAAA